MKNVWKWIKDNPNRAMFLVPILLVAGISISHVVSWYNIANPFNWAVYLSIAIEVGAMTALVAATNKIKGGVWIMFILVTIIQMIGNIFYSFKQIDSNGDLFKSWVELTSPVWEALGTEPGDVISLKRWLAFLEGGLLPIISLTSLHFFVKYDEVKPKVEGVNEGVNDTVNDTVNEVENKVEEIPTTEDEIIDDKRIDNLVDIQEEKIETTEIINEQLSEIIEEIGVDEIKDEEEVINNDNLLWSETNNIVEEDKDDKPTTKRLSYTKRG
jgi:hypothetical protein